MKKILDTLKKFNTPLYYGIVCAVFGFAFIVFPYLWKPALDILLIIAGAFSIFVGILNVSLLDTPDRSPAYYLLVGKTLCLIGFGIFLITSRSSLAWMLCIGYGVYILCRGIPMLVKCVMLPKTDEPIWWVKIILSIIEILLGLWLVIYPAWPFILAGAALLLTAVELFVRLNKKDKAATAPRMRFGTVFDPDFEDKSDK